MTGNDTPGSYDDRLVAWRRRALVIWSIIGIVLIIYFLGIVLNVLAIPLGIVIWTVIIVFLLRWQVDALSNRGLSRLAATTIAYVGFAAALIILGGFLFSPVFRVGDQFQGLLAGAPAYIEQVVEWIKEMSQRYGYLAQNPTVSSMLQDVSASATEFVRNLATSSVANLFEVTSVTANLLISFAFGLAVAFWLLLEIPGLEKEMRRLTAGSYADDFHFFHVTMSRAVGGFIRATLLQCVLIAVAVMIGFYILRVPNPVAIAVLVGVINIIPVVGPWIAAALVFFMLAFNDMMMAILAVTLVVIVQRVVYLFVSPKLMGDSVDVHPALVIITMMIGLAVGHQVGGVMGSLVAMLLSIPLAAVGKATFVYYFEKRTGRQLVAKDGVIFKGQPAADGSVNPAMDAVLPAPRRPSVREKQANKLKKRAGKKRAGQ